VLRYYGQARALDPYDTLIPMRLTQFLLACDHEDEAFEAMRKTLNEQPRSPVLRDNLVLTAIGVDARRWRWKRFRRV